MSILNIVKTAKEVHMCGFPQSSYNRVIEKLEEKKINYLISEEN